MPPRAWQEPSCGPACSPSLSSELAPSSRVVRVGSGHPAPLWMYSFPTVGNLVEEEGTGPGERKGSRAKDHPG